MHDAFDDPRPAPPRTDETVMVDQTAERPVRGASIGASMSEGHHASQMWTATVAPKVRGGAGAATSPVADSIDTSE
jgi:hypothetical protein